MSHVEVCTPNVVIDDIDLLKQACEMMGGDLELVVGQNRYKWYGHHVGDYPLPEGFTEADLGKCEHAIRVKSGNAYEVGLVKRRDGGKGYAFQWDFWGSQGAAIKKHVGDKCKELERFYIAAKAVKAIKRKGKFSITTSTNADGTIKIRAKAAKKKW